MCVLLLDVGVKLWSLAAVPVDMAVGLLLFEAFFFVDLELFSKPGGLASRGAEDQDCDAVECNRPTR
jgi:hypothetical protein